VPALAGTALLLGCGGSETSAVATVQGRTISKSALSHWASIRHAELQVTSRPGDLKASALEPAALAFLITAEWLEGEAGVQGVHLSDADLDASYRRLLNGPNGQALAASLKRRGMSKADELRLLRLSALAAKLRSKVAASGQVPLSAQARRRIGAFQAAYRERWKQRTICRPGYVIAECRGGPPLRPALGGGR
jgi:hypothetical protein